MLLRTVHPIGIIDLPGANYRTMVYKAVAGSWLLFGDTWDATILSTLYESTLMEQVEIAISRGEELDCIGANDIAEEIYRHLMLNKDTIDKHLYSVSPPEEVGNYLHSTTSTSACWSVSDDIIELD